MFVLGDLNFRTKFESKCVDGDISLSNDVAATTLMREDSNDTIEKDARVIKDQIHNISLSKVTNKNESLECALKLIEAKDWAALYNYDELSAGLKRGDLLVDFQTLPCHFNPTFKVKRSAGFEYNQQRTPSYTDRILYRSAKGIQSHLKQFAYEPCVDFITSDHKPIRGAFSVIPNAMIEPVTLPSIFQLEFSQMECFDLLSTDVNGFSDPYVMFMWDSIDLTWSGNFSILPKSLIAGSKWPTTCWKKRTLNPKWDGKKFILTSTTCLVNNDAVIYLLIYDFNFLRRDEFLGVLILSVQELVSMEYGQSEKEIVVDRPLEYYGKYSGKIKFNVLIKHGCGIGGDQGGMDANEASL